MTLKHVQARLGVEMDGLWGPKTEAAVMAALDKVGVEQIETIASVWEVKPKTIADFIGGFIDAHEGGLSLDPADNGNWTGGKRNSGALVGSKFGVTPGALAAFQGVAALSITAGDIAGITRDQAVAIGVALYFDKPGFGRLPFNRVTLSIVDKGWGSGPAQAIKLLQRMVGVAADGVLGPKTVAAYEGWLAQFGEEHGAHIWASVRQRFDASLKQPRFLAGWNNRTKSFLPGTAWWSAWG